MQVQQSIPTRSRKRTGTSPTFSVPPGPKKNRLCGSKKMVPTSKNMLPPKKRSPYIVITTLTVYIPRILPRNSASSKHHHPSGLTLPALVGCSVVWTWSFRLRSQHTGMLYTGHKLQAFSTAPCSNTDEKFVLGATKRLICQLRKLRAQKLLDKTYRFLNLKSPPQTDCQLRKLARRSSWTKHTAFLI